MLFAYHRWHRPTIFFILLTFNIVLFLQQTSNKISFVLICVLLYLTYNFILETWVALTFISPGNRKPELRSEGWVSNYHNLDSKIHTKSHFDGKIRPLVIIVHGWRSGAVSMLGRAKNYLEMGFHVIIFELPGHGLSEPVSKWTAGHASTTFNQFYDDISSVYDMNLVSQIYFHGHSMGGFVLLRFCKINSDKGKYPVAGYILESPMTCYSQIFKESMAALSIPKFAKKIFWNRLSSHFNFINPKIPNVKNIDEVDVPKWGFIDNNCLVVQAKNDDRLGLEHYHKLVESQSKYHGNLFEHHLIDDLTHAGARDNSNRDEIIRNWYEKTSNHSDSVKSA